MKFAEALVGSMGIMLVGFLTIPLAGHVAGLRISSVQAFAMSWVFFILRLLWLLALRCYFEPVATWVMRRYCLLLLWLRCYFEPVATWVMRRYCLLLLWQRCNFERVVKSLKSLRGRP